MQTIYVSVTVDWEGRIFDEDDASKCLPSLETLREEISKLGFNVPWTHYITPTYWLNDTLDPDTVFASTSAIQWDKDEIGLHVHCWQSLVAAAGVHPFLDKPTFGESTGHGTPVGAYADEDIVKIIGKAKELLETKLPICAPVKGYRCGGWMSNDSVLQALMELGFVYDCSAVPPEIFSVGYSDTNPGNGEATYKGWPGDIGGFVVDLWGYEPKVKGYATNSLSHKWNRSKAILPGTQPYKIFDGHSSIIEMPNNGGLSDYSSAEYMTETLKAVIDLAGSSDEPVFLNIGCHQEGATGWKDSLYKFFSDNKTLLLKLQTEGHLVFTTVHDAAKSADLHMVD